MTDFLRQVRFSVTAKFKPSVLLTL